MQVYLDHNATTPLRPEVRAAMLPYLESVPGNPSSLHRPGQEARAAVNAARSALARCLGGRPEEWIFVASGTEADNLAVKGAALAEPDGHVLVSAVEHPAVARSADWLAGRGYDVERIPVGGEGRVDPDSVRARLRPDTRVVSVMTVNNEVGTLQPVAEIAVLCREAGVTFHTDAAQAPGRVPIDVGALGADLVSVSAHKMHGPKGVGALYCRWGTPIVPLLHGGTHEKGRRAGTENVAGVVGLAAALELALAERVETAPRVAALRDRLEHGLLERVPGASVNGGGAERAPNVTSIAFAYVESEPLLVDMDLQGVCASSGSACSTGAVEPSPVLLAMGKSPEAAWGSVRFSLGRDTTEDEIDHALRVVPPIVARLRALSPAAGDGGGGAV
jgi:cysteine desulfurase